MSISNTPDSSRPGSPSSEEFFSAQNSLRNSPSSSSVTDVSVESIAQDALSSNEPNIDRLSIRSVEGSALGGPVSDTRDNVATVVEVAWNRARFIEQLGSFITAGMSDDIQRELIFTLGRIPVGDRANVIEVARSLITGDIAWFETVELISDIGRIPVEDRAAFVTQVGFLITDNMDGDARTTIIQALATVPVEGRDRFIEQVGSLITDDMDGAARTTIIQALAAVSIEVRAGFIAEALNIDGQERSRAIRDLAIPVIVREIESQPITYGSNISSFSVDPEGDFQNGSFELLLNFFQSILDDNRSLPRIEYLGSEGIDAGGLTRDFITRLFQALCSAESKLPMKIGDKGLLLKIDESASISKEDQIKCFKAIGTIFGAALFNRAFTTGAYFHPVMFKMIQTLSLEEIEGIPQDLADSQNLAPQTLEKLQKAILSALYPQVFSDQAIVEAAFAYRDREIVEHTGITLNGFLSENLEINNIASAVAIIAKAMKEQLGEEFESKIPATYQELSEIIQGTEVSRETVLVSLGEDPNAKQLKEWVEQATPEQLKQFVFAITGSTTLRSGSNLSVTMIDNSSDVAFFFHTCFSRVDIKQGLTEEEFKSQLDASIQGGGFDRA